MFRSNRRRCSMFTSIGIAYVNDFQYSWEPLLPVAANPLDEMRTPKPVRHMQPRNTQFHQKRDRTRVRT